MPAIDGCGAAREYRQLGSSALAQLLSSRGKSAGKPLTGIIIVTGGSTGIGAAVVRALEEVPAVVAGSARVISLSRSAGGLDPADITTTQGSCWIKCDLGSPTSITAAAQRITQCAEAWAMRVAALVANAGVFRLFSTAGHEFGQGLDGNFAINHLGHFHLYLAMEPLLDAGSARVIVVSSNSHYSTAGRNIRAKMPLREAAAGWNPHEPYSMSKLANVMFGLEVNRRARARGSGVRAYIVHPGALVGSDIAHGLPLPARMGLRALSYFTPTVDEAGATIVWLLLDPELGGRGGLYFDRFDSKMPTPEARDMELRERLWNLSLELLGENAPTKESSLAGHTRSRRGTGAGLVPVLEVPGAEGGSKAHRKSLRRSVDPTKVARRRSTSVSIVQPQK